MRIERINPHKVFRKYLVHKTYSSGRWCYLLIPFEVESGRVSHFVGLSNSFNEKQRLTWGQVTSQPGGRWRPSVARLSGPCSAHWQLSFPFLSGAAVRWTHWLWVTVGPQKLCVEGYIQLVRLLGGSVAGPQCWADWEQEAATESKGQATGTETRWRYRSDR